MNSSKTDLPAPSILPLAFCGLLVFGMAACAEESPAAEAPSDTVLERLEATERRLAETEARLQEVLARDAERAAWERSVTARLPAVGEGDEVGATFQPASSTVANEESVADPELAAQLEQLNVAVEQLSHGMQEMGAGVEQLGTALRVTTLHEYSKIALFAQLRGETMWSSARPVVPGAPLFLSPGSLVGLSQDTFDVHAKSTLLGAGFQGPDWGCCETGGLVTFALYSETVVQDVYGIMPLLAYGEIKREDFRFVGGLQFDVFNPVTPTMVNFMTLWASGNTGAYRGQMRLDKNYFPTCDTQLSLQGSIGEALPTTIVNNRVNGNVLNEDNGLPDFQGRVAWGVGPMLGEGAAAKRPFEVGVSGVYGQVRSTVLPANRVVNDVWAVGLDLRYEITECYGFQGELFRGDTIGTYLGSVGQMINTVTLRGINSAGGWGEFYYYLSPCVHLHAGYGVDNPYNSDLAVGQISYNETIFGTIFWEATESLRFGLEISHRATDYVLLPDNEGMLVHTQVQWSF